MYNTRRSFSCTLAAIFPNLGSQSANLLPSFPLWNIQIRLPTSLERYAEWPADLNQLTDDDLTARTGLVQIVHQPTRGTNILYRIFVSNPQLYSSVRVVASVVRSDHKAVVLVAFSDVGHCIQQKTKMKRTYRPKSPAQHASFLDHAANVNFDNPYPAASSDPSVNTQA